jgi:creatinine amidohydrolase
MPQLAHLTTTAAKETLDDAEVAVIAVGSTEQHGPHLPLGTDHIIADALAQSVHDRTDAVVLPLIPVGVSPHHRHFDGTLSTSSDVLEAYLRDIFQGMASHGVEKTVVVNGHGGNTDAIRRAAEELRREQTAYVTTWSWSDAVADLKRELFDMKVGHADGSESSVMLYLADELVDEAAFSEAEDGGPESETWGLSVHGGTLPFDTIDFTETGATGYPTEATVEAGEKLFVAASEELDNHIDWVIEQDLAELWPKPHK